MSDKTTHFGYKTVKTEEKAEKVAEVFHSVASSYDLMNDLMSAGIHRLWKRMTIEMSGVRRGHKVLDIAGGTGDLAAKFSRIVGSEGQVVLADINDSMLKVGRDRLMDRGVVSNIQFAQANAQYLPFPDNTFDLITIAFGLRNVTDKAMALRSMNRVLKPGGKLLVLEFSKPTSSLLSKIYDSYSFNVLPKLGQLFASDSDSYQYLAESIRMHPDQESLQTMVEEAGFSNCDYHNMTGGIVALHRGVKALVIFNALQSSALEAVEKLINSALEYDPATQRRIAELEGETSTGESTAPPFSVAIEATSTGIMLHSNWQDSADTKVSGPLLAMLELAASNEEQISFAGTGISVNGDLDFLIKINTLMRELDVDWGAALASIIGDIPAHLLADRLRSSAALAKQAAPGPELPR